MWKTAKNGFWTLDIPTGMKVEGNIETTIAQQITTIVIHRFRVSQR